MLKKNFRVVAIYDMEHVLSYLAKRLLCTFVAVFESGPFSIATGHMVDGVRSFPLTSMSYDVSFGIFIVQDLL